MGSAGRSCESCQFWKANGTLPQIPGECHRNAPTVHVEPAALKSGSKWSTERFFPPTLANDWCGDWEQA